MVRGYFAAIAAQDLEALLSYWADGGLDRFVGLADLRAPDEVRAYFAEVFGAFPAWDFDVVDRRVDREWATTRWRLRATFAGPGRFDGLEPNGAKADIEGCDVTCVRGGRVHSNHAYLDRLDLARQLGALPARHGRAERVLTAALNARTRLARRHRRRSPPS